MAVSETWLPYKISSLLQDGFPLLVCEGSPPTPHILMLPSQPFLSFIVRFSVPSLPIKFSSSLHLSSWFIFSNYRTRINMAWTHCNLRCSLIVA